MNNDVQKPSISIKGVSKTIGITLSSLIYGIVYIINIYAAYSSRIAASHIHSMSGEAGWSYVGFSTILLGLIIILAIVSFLFSLALSFQSSLRIFLASVLLVLILNSFFILTSGFKEVAVILALILPAVLVAIVKLLLVIN